MLVTGLAANFSPLPLPSGSDIHGTRDFALRGKRGVGFPMGERSPGLNCGRSRSCLPCENGGSLNLFEVAVNKSAQLWRLGCDEFGVMLHLCPARQMKNKPRSPKRWSEAVTIFLTTVAARRWWMIGSRLLRRNRLQTSTCSIKLAMMQMHAQRKSVSCYKYLVTNVGRDYRQRGVNEE